MYQKLISTAAVAGENIISNLGQMSDFFPSISPSFSFSASAIFKVCYMRDLTVEWERAVCFGVSLRAESINVHGFFLSFEAHVQS